MSEENKALARRFYAEVFGQGNMSVIDDLMAPDFVDHNPPGPGFAPGREGTQQVVGMFRSAFPDLQFIVEDQIAEGDKVVNRLAVKGTHRGEFAGVPATGKSVTIGVVDILRISGGKAVERWGEADMLGLMQQLGVVPVPEQAG